jgi:hypothetical protein
VTRCIVMVQDQIVSVSFPAFSVKWHTSNSSTELQYKKQNWQYMRKKLIVCHTQAEKCAQRHCLLRFCDPQDFSFVAVCLCACLGTEILSWDCRPRPKIHPRQPSLIGRLVLMSIMRRDSRNHPVLC